jgi:ribonucleoside-diphosphate reductase beta chain
VKTDELMSGDIAGVNQILPHRHPWAWELFLKSQANNWVPSEVPMAKDAEQWRDPRALTEDERLVVRRCLGFFAGSESLVANNLLLTVHRHVTDPECRQYILRQAFEESLHNQTIVYVCDSLGLEIADVYEAYRSVPSIRAKDDFLLRVTAEVNRPTFRVPPWPRRPDPADYPADEAGQSRFARDLAGYPTVLWADNAIAPRQEILRNLINYYLICEGTFFFSGFAMLLAFGRQNKLPGLAKQVEFTLRDETLHIQFGTRLVNAIATQYPEVWSEKFREETIAHVREAVDLEVAYAHDVLPRGVLGLSAGQFVEYMRFNGNRRLEAVGLPAQWPGARNPFPWLAEVSDLFKSENFFETTVTQYSTGRLVDDF